MFTNYTYLLFIPGSSYFQKTNDHLCIIENWLSFITLLKKGPACHLTTVLIPTR